MDKKFNSGDVVRLKSGGPEMTVDRYVPHFDQEVAANGDSVSAFTSNVVKNGEDVRCYYFSTTLDGSYANFASQIQVHEDALKGPL